MWRVVATEHHLVDADPIATLGHFYDVIDELHRLALRSSVAGVDGQDEVAVRARRPESVEVRVGERRALLVEYEAPHRHRRAPILCRERVLSTRARRVDRRPPRDG